MARQRTTPTPHIATALRRWWRFASAPDLPSWWDGNRARAADGCVQRSTRGAACFVEPDPDLGHFRLLLGGRVAGAGGGLGCPFSGAPAGLDAVVGVVGDLQRGPPGQEVSDGQLLRRAVAARVG